MCVLPAFRRQRSFNVCRPFLRFFSFHFSFILVCQYDARTPKYHRFASSFASIRASMHTVGNKNVSYSSRQRLYVFIRVFFFPFFLYTRILTVVSSVWCTQTRKCALVRAVWMTFTFNFVCIWFLFLCNAIALAMARITHTCIRRTRSFVYKRQYTQHTCIQWVYFQL